MASSQLSICITGPVSIADLICEENRGPLQWRKRVRKSKEIAPRLELLDGPLFGGFADIARWVVFEGIADSQYSRGAGYAASFGDRSPCH